MSGNKENKEEFSFIKEKIKDKPFNRKKAAAKIGYTIGLAILFGVVAGFTFVMTKSVFEPMLGKQSEPEKVVIPRDENDSSEDSTQEDESSYDEELSLEEEKENSVTLSEERDSSPDSTKEDFTLEDVENLYQELYETARECEKSMVTVTGVTSDVDWFNNTYESEGQSAGMIVVNTGGELLVCADYRTVKDVESITVTFYDGEVVTASLKKYDGNTGISILSVDANDIPVATMNQIQVVTLGNSYTSNKGDFVIAVGSPLGYSESISYGILTSTSNSVSTSDCDYRILCTDVAGSSSGSGVIINLEGEVIGIIEPEYGLSDNANSITALAISDLKSVIERLSNDQDIVYMGIKGSDVTMTISDEQGIPKGVYVTETLMGSPAMNAGIQSGDVIVDVNGEEVVTLRDFQNELVNYAPSEVVSVTAMRLGMGEWKEINFTVTLDAIQ